MAGIEPTTQVSASELHQQRSALKGCTTDQPSTSPFRKREGAALLAPDSYAVRVTGDFKAAPVLTTARNGLSAFGGFARLRLTHLPLSGESPTIHSIQLATRAFSRSPFSPFRKLDAGRCDRALFIPRRGQRDLETGRTPPRLDTVDTCLNSRPHGFGSGRSSFFPGLDSLRISDFACSVQLPSTPPLRLTPM